jgi:hypothetical protein
MSLDLGRSILQRANFWHRVGQPNPGLVEQGNVTGRGEMLNERFELGEVQASSMWLTNGPTTTSSTGPSPNT